MARPRTWTEAKALELGEKLLTFVQTDGNYFLEKYLIANGLDVDLPRDLSNRYPSFSRLIVRCRKIQEIKISEGSMDGTLNAKFCQFLLNCKFGWVPESKETQTVNANVTSNINTVYQVIPIGCKLPPQPAAG